jgi:hypothetical protein
MSTNIPFAPLIPDPLAERRTQALEKTATAQTDTATHAERAASAMEAAAGFAGYERRRAEVLALLVPIMGSRLAADTHGAVEMALQTVERVDELMPAAGRWRTVTAS